MHGDSPPIKVTSGGNEGGDTTAEGTAQVELATAVSTSTSSHAFNNTSNSWSTTHYSNKSDIGHRSEGIEEGLATGAVGLRVWGGGDTVGEAGPGYRYAV